MTDIKDGFVQIHSTMLLGLENKLRLTGDHDLVNAYNRILKHARKFNQQFEEEQRAQRFVDNELSTYQRDRLNKFLSRHRDTLFKLPGFDWCLNTPNYAGKERDKLLVEFRVTGIDKAQLKLILKEVNPLKGQMKETYRIDIEFLMKYNPHIEE